MINNFSFLKLAYYNVYLSTKLIIYNNKEKVNGFLEKTIKIFQTRKYHNHKFLCIIMQKCLHIINFLAIIKS